MVRKSAAIVFIALAVFVIAVQRDVESVPNLERASAIPLLNDAAAAAIAPLPDDNVVLLATEHQALETSIAISHSNPDVALVGAMSYHDGRRVPFCDAYVTRDGGKTWIRRTLSLTGSNGFKYNWHSDPAVGIDRSGTMYYTTMMIEGFPGKIGMAVARSTDNGETWTTPVMVSDTDGVTLMDDKQWLAADDTGGLYEGHVYLMWGRYKMRPDRTSEYGEIMFSRSTDKGLTWSEPTAMTPKGSAGMSMLAIGPEGEVYAAFNAGGLKVRVSKDGGATFSEARAIPAQFGPGGTIPNTQANFSPMPTMVVDRSFGPYRGTLYYFFPGRGGRRTNAVYASGAVLYRSRDGGATWLAPQILSGPENKNDSVFPMIAVDPKTGDAVASWLDRRDDEKNTLFRVYATRSIDGGETWETARAFSSPFSLDRAFLGHYLWSAASHGRWLTTFTTGGGAMSVAHLDFGQPKPPVDQRPPGKKRRAS